MKKISLLIASYKTPERLLKECLDSIFLQITENVEVVICEQGEENLHTLVNQYGEKIRIIHQNEPNLYNARRALWYAASGDYAWFVDADDLIENDALEILNYLINNNQPDVILFNFSRFDKENRVLRIGASFPQKMSANELINILLSGDSYNSIWRKVFSRSLEPKFYDAPIFWAEDKMISLALAKEVETIICVDKPLYRYRINPSSGTNKIDLSLLKDYGICWKILEEHFSSFDSRFGSYKAWINGAFSNCAFFIRNRQLSKKDFLELFASPEASDFVRYLKNNKSKWLSTTGFARRFGYLLFLNKKYLWLAFMSLFQKKQSKTRKKDY